MFTKNPPLRWLQVATAMATAPFAAITFVAVAFALFALTPAPFALSALKAAEPEVSRYSPAEPIPFAHAHNDYEHKQPLLEALSHGFVSVEADIWLIDGQLLVSHELEDVSKEKTLQALYLEPLKQIAAGQNGRILKRDEPFYLMIDLKSDGPSTLAALRKVLPMYKDMLTHYTNEKTEPAAVSIVLSGSRPEADWWKEPERLFSLDGRPSDLEENRLGAHYIPWISDDYFNHFTYIGFGEMPAAEREKLKSLVDKAHAQGRMVRFWAAPGTRTLWSVFRDNKVDLLNVDDLAGFETWARERMKSDSPAIHQ